MVISTTAPVSEETYREIALGDPNLELHHGQLREKPSMSVEHNDVTDLLVTMLRDQLDRNEYWVRENFGRLRRSADTYYIPDVVVIPTALLRALRARPGSLDAHTEPDAAGRRDLVAFDGRLRREREAGGLPRAR